MERKAEERTLEMEDIASNLGDLEANVAQLDNWLSDSIASLKTRQKGANQKAVKAKVDSLYNEKREKEYDMERLRSEAKGIIDGDNVCDTFALKECVGEVEVKWHDLTEHLVQQVSLEVGTTLCCMSVTVMIH